MKGEGRERGGVEGGEGQGAREGEGSPESNFEHILEISARKGMNLPQTSETCWKQAAEASPSAVRAQEKREEAGPGGPCHHLAWSWATSRDPARPDGRDLGALRLF